LTYYYAVNKNAAHPNAVYPLTIDRADVTILSSWEWSQEVGKMRSMKLRTKILLAYIVPLSIVVLGDIIVYRALSLGLDTAAWVNHTNRVISDATTLSKAAIDAEAGTRGYLLTGDEEFLAPYRTGLDAFAHTAAELRQLVADNPAQLTRLDNIESLHRQWIIRAAEPEIRARRAGNNGEAVRLVQEGDGRLLQDQLGREIALFVQEEERLLNQRAAANERAAGQAIFFAVATPILAILLALTFALFQTRQLSHIVNEYASFSEQVAAGNLATQLDVQTEDELGFLSRHMNSMVASLAELAHEVQAASDNVAAAAAEILETVYSHTATAHEQATSISQVTARMETVRAASETAAAQAHELAQKAQTSMRVSHEGTEAVQAIVYDMEDIRLKVKAIAQDILNLAEKTKLIGEITATVNDLADQSNLLALNAAIEAARAGEQGRGFAVVANEVRVLAEQSKQATARVRAILEDIQKATEAAVLVTEAGADKVESGLTRAQRAGDIIVQLANTVQDASNVAPQIVQATHEQNEAIEAMVFAMKEIDQSTTKSAAAGKQSEAVAQQLNELTRHLKSMTEQYTLDGKVGE